MMPKLSDTVLMGVMVAVLTGCVASAPRPVAVEVARSGIEVRLSDGSRCQGPAPAGGADRWSGRLIGCTADYPYSVRIETNPNLLRRGVEIVLDELGAGDLLYPMAEVEITGPDGRIWHFASPPPAG